MHPVTWSAPEDARGGTHLLVMLHGYGSDESALTPLFPHLPEGITGAALRGPFDVGGRSGWFLLDPMLESDEADVLAAGSSLLSTVSELKQQGNFSGVSLLGFSQGMAMAVTALRLRPEEFTCVVGLSGFVVRSELLAMAEPLARPVPFFWGRDRGDWVIHADAVAEAERWLEANTLLTARTYPDMGHRIGADEMRDVGIFLRAFALSTEKNKAPY
ncbi:alpha/beta hydrolase [Arthrobacter koreensis]|uniref:alpha/beta hydrolase n=1 Tax=Arthrobacter koreensis TaxID=199136 RepID=UPI002DB7C6A6|nr:alpha/beta hydrolase-fold protein [Arthrobacter koreensis]MEB7446961.1 alpha/beta hydrolase [Arthrobacter koreensis]